MPPQSCSTSVSLRCDAQVIEQRFQVIDATAPGCSRSGVVGLVGQAAADVVGHDDPVRLCREGSDQVAVVERPRRVAVEHDDRLALALVEVVDAQPAVRSRVLPGCGRRKACSVSGSAGEVVPGIGSPFHPQHQAVQSAADAQEADAVAGPQELALLGQRRGQRQRHGADVAQIAGTSRSPSPRAMPSDLQDRVAMAGADLVADHLVHLLRRPSRACRGTPSRCAARDRRRASARPTESVEVNWRELARRGRFCGWMPQRHRPWCCGAVWVDPAQQPAPRLAANEPSVTSTATAPEPPVSVASESLKHLHAPFAGSIRSIIDVVDLAGRLAGDDQAGPDLAQLDPVGDLDHAVEHAQAGVADVVDGRVGADAQIGERPGTRWPARSAPGRRRRRSVHRSRSSRPAVWSGQRWAAVAAPRRSDSPLPTSAARRCRQGLELAGSEVQRLIDRSEPGLELGGGNNHRGSS